MSERIGKLATVIVAMFVLGSLAYIGGCTEPASELPPVLVCPDTTALMASLESCRTQRAAAVANEERLIGEVADLSIELRLANDRIRELEQAVGMGEPIMCAEFADPPEEWCTWRVR